MFAVADLVDNIFIIFVLVLFLSRLLLIRFLSLPYFYSSSANDYFFSLKVYV